MVKCFLTYQSCETSLLKRVIIFHTSSSLRWIQTSAFITQQRERPHTYIHTYIHTYTHTHTPVCTLWYGIRCYCLGQSDVMFVVLTSINHGRITNACAGVASIAGNEVKIVLCSFLHAGHRQVFTFHFLRLFKAAVSITIFVTGRIGLLHNFIQLRSLQPQELPKMLYNMKVNSHVHKSRILVPMQFSP
jgi:hypothetical protein